MVRVDNTKSNVAANKTGGNKNINTSKIKNTRTIRTQLHNENRNLKDHNRNNNAYNQFLSKDLSLIKTDDYVGSKKQEIHNLFNTILKNKKFGSNKRAFQNLPRHLRRRTCSHNLKRVPKRIRKRTLKEMAKSDQKVINGNTDSLKHKKSLTNKQYYKMKMSVKLLKMLTRSKFMRRSIPAKIGKFNVGSRFQLRARIKMMEKFLLENKKGNENQLQHLLNNKLGHVDIVGENEIVEDTLRLNKSFKYYKRQQGNGAHKWLPSHIYNIKRCHMIKYHGFKVALKPTLKCYRSIYRNNGLNSRSDKTLIQDTCHLGKILITKLDGEGLFKLLSSKFDEKDLKFSYNGVYVSGNYYGAANYMKWVERDSKLLLILDSAVYKKVLERLFALFASEIASGSLKVEDLTFALGTIKLIGSSSLNTLLKCTRSYSETDSEHSSFDDLVALGTQIRDYEDILNDNFMLGMNVKDPRLVKYPSLPNVKNRKVLEIDCQYILKWQAMKRSDTNQQLKDLMDHDKRYQSYENKLTVKQLHRTMTESVKSSDSNIPMVIYKDNDSTSNSFSIMLPYHWVMPFYYKLNQLPTTQLIGLNQINQISFDNGAGSLIKNPLMNVTTWQFNYFNYFNALSEREHWLKKNKARRVNYDSIKVNYDGLVAAELGDPFKSDWKFFYELVTREKDDIERFLADYQWNFEDWNKQFVTKFTLLGNQKRKDLIDLVVGKIEIVPGTKGSIKTNARIFRIPKEKAVSKESALNLPAEKLTASVTDLVGFVSVGCYDLAEGHSTGYAFYNLTHSRSNHAQEYLEDTFLVKNPGENVFRIVQKVT